MSEKKTLLHPAMIPRPRRPIVEKMCSSCPFRPDGGAPKITVSPEDMEGFKLTARTGEFYCHETVLEDPRTKRDHRTGDSDPKAGVQPHFKVCRGGWEYKLTQMKKRL
jgi:hypothetical protein